MTDNEIINALEYIRYHLTASKHKEVIDDAIDVINHQQAEIERLNNNISAMATTLSNSAKETRAEAIKEFTERLCEGRVSNDPVVIAAKVELKEMVGDTE